MVVVSEKGVNNAVYCEAFTTVKSVSAPPLTLKSSNVKSKEGSESSAAKIVDSPIVRVGSLLLSATVGMVVSTVITMSADAVLEFPAASVRVLASRKTEASSVLSGVGVMTKVYSVSLTVLKLYSESLILLKLDVALPKSEI